MKPDWLDDAYDDLDHIYKYIAEDCGNPPAAARVFRTIVSFTNSTLNEHPRRGRPGRVDNTRELVVADLPSYIVTYTFVGERPTILRVLHGAQEWPKTF